MVDDIPYLFPDDEPEPAALLEPDLIRCTDFSRALCGKIALLEDFPERFAQDVWNTLHDPESYCVVGMAQPPHYPDFKRWDGRRWGINDGCARKRLEVAGVLVSEIWRRKSATRARILCAVTDERMDPDYVETWMLQELMKDGRDQQWESIFVSMMPDDPSANFYADLGFTVADVNSAGAYIFEWAPDRE